jgi:hypothetical protein
MTQFYGQPVLRPLERVRRRLEPDQRNTSRCAKRTAKRRETTWNRSVGLHEGHPCRPVLRNSAGAPASRSQCRRRIRARFAGVPPVAVDQQHLGRHSRNAHQVSASGAAHAACPIARVQLRLQCRRPRCTVVRPRTRASFSRLTGDRVTPSIARRWNSPVAATQSSSAPSTSRPSSFARECAKPRDAEVDSRSGAVPCGLPSAHRSSGEAQRAPGRSAVRRLSAIRAVRRPDERPRMLTRALLSSLPGEVTNTTARVARCR